MLPHFYLFAPLVYVAEVLTAISLLLGVFVRLWGVIGALQIQLWLGLYSAQGEWPWTRSLLLEPAMLIFALHRYGRRLGLDAIIVARSQTRNILKRIFLAMAT